MRRPARTRPVPRDRQRRQRKCGFPPRDLPAAPCPPDLLDGVDVAARSLLRGANLAATRVRLACLSAAVRAGRPVGREDFARAACPLDRVTLYRTLRTFEAAGLVRRSAGSRGETWCLEVCEHGFVECPGHMHFECRSCGRVTCVRAAPSRVSRAVGAIFEENGFPVSGLRVEAYGTCGDCAAPRLRTRPKPSRRKRARLRVRGAGRPAGRNP